jgi:hypothetical protein
MNDEPEGISKEAVVGLAEVVSQKLPEGADKTQ